MPFVAVYASTMEVARSLDQRPTEEALLLSHERSFSHFVSRLLVSFLAAITSRRSKKSRETFAREFANFSIALHGMTGRELFARLLVKARVLVDLNGWMRG